MTKRPLRKHEFEQIGDAQRPRVVAPARRSGFRERPKGVALAPVLSSVSSKERATLGCRSNEVALRGKAQRLYGIAPVRSLQYAARPMITLNTSFELQMHPNVSKNSMWYSNT